MEIRHEQGYRDFVQKEVDSKKRYNLKYGFEKHHRDKNEQEFEGAKQNLANKVSYERFRVADERNYDILNFDETKSARLKSSMPLHKEMNAWEKLNFNSKTDVKTFREEFDVSEKLKSKNLFLEEREKSLVKLASDKQDEFKKYEKKERPKRTFMHRPVTVNVDKQKFFDEKRIVDSNKII